MTNLPRPGSVKDDAWSSALDCAFDFSEYPVPPHLSRWILRITGYAEHGRGGLHQRQPADIGIPLVIDFGEPFLIGLGRPPTKADAWPSFTSGLFSGPVYIRSSGRAACIQIDFTPLGARRFFAVPLAEIAGRMVALDDVLGAEGRRLRERLGNLPDWAGRFDAILPFLDGRLHAGAQIERGVAEACRLIAVSGGARTVATVADAVGWSRQHLHQRFSENIGLSPKAFARLVRFRAALAATRAPGMSLADVAATYGYADQAHFTRDFSALAGTSPASWRRQALAA